MIDYLNLFKSTQKYNVKHFDAGIINIAKGYPALLEG
jgi:hypothetical protein